MGKSANCLLMLQILNSGRIYKIKELAELLDTKERNIIEYKNELIELNYDIVSISGPAGGYKLNKSQVIPSLKMTSEEKASISEAFNYILSKKDFINKNGYTKTMSKVFSSLLIENTSPNGLLSVNKINSNIGYNVLENNYEAISKSIKNKKALKIEYNWLKEPSGVITIHPYQLFLYDNEWRFFAWCVERGQVLYLKLARVGSIEVLNKSFSVSKLFKPEDYLKKGVFSPNGEMVKISLIASGVRAKLFAEKQFGANQSCEKIDDDKIKVSLEMQKNPSTYNEILGWGDLVEIIEPQWLKDTVRDLAFSIYKKYTAK